MWVAVVIVASFGLLVSLTLGHPTSETEAPAIGTVNGSKKNEIANQTIIGGHNHIEDNSGTGCACVNNSRCKDLKTNGEEDLGPNEKPIECPHIFERCCFNSTGVEEPSTTSTLTSPTSPSPCLTVADERQCGTPGGLPINPHRETRASDTSGQADYMEFPWMVWIGNPSLTTRCGGSLIHPQVVLTGAHCVNGKEDVVVRAGEWNIQAQDQKELFPHQEVKVKEIVVHEKFNKGSLANDIALLILESPVNTTGNVGIIYLSARGKFDAKQCLMSGWGDQLNSTKDQTILKRVGPLPIVPRGVCQEALRKTRLGQHFRLHETFVCAAGGTSAKSYTCKGDGGGPLACPISKNSVIYVQAGILAWGISCGPETPAVYANVSLFVPWIQDQLKAKGIHSFQTLETVLEDNSHLLVDVRVY